MGELPPDEAAALRAQMAADPELSKLHARLQHAVELLREASAIPEHPATPLPARLSSERREHLLAHFRAPAPAPAPAPTPIAAVPRRDWKWVVPLGLAASLIAFLGWGVVLNSVVSKSSIEAPDFSAEGGALVSGDVANNATDWGSQPGMIRRWREGAARGGGAGLAERDAMPLDQRVPSSRANSYFASTDGSSVAAPSGPSVAPAKIGSGSLLIPSLAVESRASHPTNGAVPRTRTAATPAPSAPLFATINEATATPALAPPLPSEIPSAGALSFTGAIANPGAPAQPASPPARWNFESKVTATAPSADPQQPLLTKNLGTLGDKAERRSGELSAITTNSSGTTLNRGTIAANDPAKPLAWFADAERFGTSSAAQPIDKFDRIEGSKGVKEEVNGRLESNLAKAGDLAGLKMEAAGNQPLDPKSNTSKLRGSRSKPVSAGQPIEIAKLKETELKQALKEIGADDVRSHKPAADAPEPQPEIATSANPFSTFSLNVSDVAFKLAGASLEQGKMPEPATVRSEEFINAFDYRDPEPAAGAPLAFASERARYPFAQNRDLLRLSVKTAAAGRQPGRALNIVLLLDNSGSMERADRVRILHEALRVLATQLQPHDKLSVVTFSRTPRLWADGVAGDHAGEVTARVGEITPQGGTNLAAALDLGYATALRHYQPGSINRVVLLTDGAANLGDVNPDALKQKVEVHRKQGVALDCFGIGWEGYDDAVLEALSRNGDGRYGFINSPEEAATEFAGQLAGALRVAASDVKVQVEWNPRRVTAYRQIGYAKHQLTKEQFRDNTVDAAEIGAAESGNALYVLEVNPRGEGDLATVRVRFKVPGTSDYKEHEWTVPYTKDAPPLEQASPALRLAGTASAFSEWLVASPYAAEVTTDRLLGLLNGVPAIYGADPRPQKLEWMIRTAKSVSGR